MADMPKYTQVMLNKIVTIMDHAYKPGIVHNVNDEILAEFKAQNAVAQSGEEPSAPIPEARPVPRSEQPRMPVKPAPSQAGARPRTRTK